jgi:hypothetical protein
MSQLLRIQGEVFHIPSVARTRLYSTPYLGRPFILITNHSGAEHILKYALTEWHTASQDYKKLEACRSACFEALKKVPLMEESQAENPLIECERRLR